MGYEAESGAVRTISGTMKLHMELERRIARFKNVEACVVLQSGFAANAGTVGAVLTPEAHVISNALNHASTIDGAMLSRAKINVYPHKHHFAADRILAGLEEAGFDTRMSDTPITPVMVGERGLAHQFSRACSRKVFLHRGLDFPRLRRTRRGCG